MSFVFKRFFSSNLSDTALVADLRRIAIEADPMSDRATRLRSIAQDVLTSVRAARCVAVVPVGGGNTSWLTANLAYALAETRHTVCLVEADLRKPRLASVFDLPASVPGLSDVLKETIGLDAAKHQINPYLTIIPGGEYHDDVVGLVASSRFPDVLKNLAGAHSLTLVSCPSSADYFDHSFIARFCEGAIIVAQKNKCRMADAIHLRSELEKLGLPLLYALLAKT